MLCGPATVPLKTWRVIMDGDLARLEWADDYCGIFAITLMETIVLEEECLNHGS